MDQLLFPSPCHTHRTRTFPVPDGSLSGIAGKRCFHLGRLMEIIHCIRTASTFLGKRMRRLADRIRRFRNCHKTPAARPRYPTDAIADGLHQQFRRVRLKALQATARQYLTTLQTDHPATYAWLSPAEKKTLGQMTDITSNLHRSFDTFFETDVERLRAEQPRSSARDILWTAHQSIVTAFDKLSIRGGTASFERCLNNLLDQANARIAQDIEHQLLLFEAALKANRV